MPLAGPRRSAETSRLRPDHTSHSHPVSLPLTTRWGNGMLMGGYKEADVRGLGAGQPSQPLFFLCIGRVFGPLGQTRAWSRTRVLA